MKLKNTKFVAAVLNFVIEAVNTSEQGWKQLSSISNETNYVIEREVNKTNTSERVQGLRRVEVRENYLSLQCCQCPHELGTNGREKSEQSLRQPSLE